MLDDNTPVPFYQETRRLFRAARRETMFQGERAQKIVCPEEHREGEK
jgi:hypothetical protein